MTGKGEGWLAAGFGLGRIWGGPAQYPQDVAAPRRLPRGAKQGQESRDQCGGEPNPWQLTLQDFDTRRREEGADTHGRDANRTPGEEIPGILKRGEEGDP
jgi:hypothetical protein